MALKESLALFPVDELKAEQRLIIKKIVAMRDVFGQLLTGYGKNLTFNGAIARTRKGACTVISCVARATAICISCKVSEVTPRLRRNKK